MLLMPKHVCSQEKAMNSYRSTASPVVNFTQLRFNSALNKNNLYICSHLYFYFYYMYLYYLCHEQLVSFVFQYILIFIIDLCIFYNSK